jgi:RNA polymerase sigma-70 factor, ECF subfamily
VETAQPSVRIDGGEDLREAVALALQGDRTATATIYTRLYPMVLAIELSLTRGDHDLAADLVQETFTKALFRLDRFEWRGPASLRAWIATIARNTFRDHVRSAAERHHGGYEVPDQIDATDADRPEAVVERDLEGTTAFAGRVLGALKPEHQLVLRRTLGEGRSASDVARELGRSEAAIHQLKRRALDAARRAAEQLATADRAPP